MYMKNKDQQFQALVEAYHKPLYRYAYWLTNDESVAEDLVQETFMRAWRALDSLQNVDAAKSWLITILRRENARRFQRKSLEYSDIETDELPDNSGHYAFSTNLETLRNCMGRLSEKYREPIVMQLVLGYSQDEIATALEIPSNTVATRLRRARQQLQAMLGGNDEQGYSRGVGV
ncbi:sigma-70 family RNA polymerase sigma factor [Spartinivicinus poritis]|uniref:RNA polymerase sigma factor n=1 Tax=Spartinivicinus poritis TaxID=2994640 RepID=A0ABT5U8V6_9GAMM|nr:sigma-70 family RNA polymerase sigma factor [Spartinivicinus sp. A2-2]MDE1461982.1 sigma-70 family RNA polymerase sigma factor [Spartinivicinus sp. A2-2]